MVQEAYVHFETAKLLKEKGFDVPTTHWYNIKGSLINDYTITYENFINPEKVWLAPTHQMACAWLREKEIEVDVYLSHITEEFSKRSKNYVFIINDINKGYDYPNDKEDYEHYYPSYEEAVEEAIKYVLENLI